MGTGGRENREMHILCRHVVNSKDQTVHIPPQCLAYRVRVSFNSHALCCSLCFVVSGSSLRVCVCVFVRVGVSVCRFHPCSCTRCLLLLLLLLRRLRLRLLLLVVVLVNHSVLTGKRFVLFFFAYLLQKTLIIGNSLVSCFFFLNSDVISLSFFFFFFVFLCYLFVVVYIYIYILRQRERERDVCCWQWGCMIFFLLCLFLSLPGCVIYSSFSFIHRSIFFLYIFFFVFCFLGDGGGVWGLGIVVKSISSRAQFPRKTNTHSIRGEMISLLSFFYLLLPLFLEYGTEVVV